LLRRVSTRGEWLAKPAPSGDAYGLTRDRDPALAACLLQRDAALNTTVRML
jgi:hypothetical protein